MKPLLCVIIVLITLSGLTQGFVFKSLPARLILQTFGRKSRRSSSIIQQAMNIIATKENVGLGLRISSAAGAQSPEDAQKIKPQDLLRKYGPAYLVTSITLAILSYAICYLMISTGVDVLSLLEKFGIKSSVAAANTGTAAIAYAVHKAASPIRFPPTVALTPVVARWFGRKSNDEKKQIS